MQRRLNLIILVHLWALTPLALLWFLVPAWRGPGAPSIVRELGILAVIAGAYLAARTWLTITSRMQFLNTFWPFLDATMVTIALIMLRNPSEALSALYFIPLASAVASLRVLHLAALAAFSTAGYLVVVQLSGVPWSVQTVFRLVIIVIIASLYGWVLRTVTAYERAAERAEFQTELAREIHDGIQHLLVTLGARLELAHRLIAEAPSRAAQIIVEERETARRAADELRYLVRRLRTPAQQADLGTALRLQIVAMAERWPFDLEVHAAGPLPRLAPAAEHAILRVIQESLTNTAKHAKANHVDVRLEAADHTLQCTIRDDGTGFDPVAGSGSGLAGLQERVRSAGGTLQIASTPGHGTTITATFPVPAARPRVSSLWRD